VSLLLFPIRFFESILTLFDDNAGYAKVELQEKQLRAQQASQLQSSPGAKLG